MHCADWPEPELLLFLLETKLDFSGQGPYLYVNQFQAFINHIQFEQFRFEPVHEISNNVVCATSKASDQPAHTRSLIRAFASRLSIL